jgi:hypothetical protein
MTGLKRQVGAGRIVQPQSALADGSPPKAEHLDALLHILAQTEMPRALRSRPGCTPRFAKPGVRAGSGSRATIPIPTGAGPAAAASGHSADGPTDRPTKSSFGPTMRRGRIDPHLVRLVEAWPSLPTRVREAIVAMIDAAGQNRAANAAPQSA